MVLIAVALGLIAFSPAYSQGVSWTGALKGYPAAALQPGTPTGSYALSGFDTINPFTGKLNVSLPLTTISGRGEVHHTLFLNITDSWWLRRWVYYDASGNISSYSFFPTMGTDTEPPRYGLPQLSLTKNAATLNQTQCFVGGTGSSIQTISRLTVQMPDGTKHELRDSPSNNAIQLYDTCTGTPYVRGNVFTSADATSQTFTSDASIQDAQPSTAPPPSVPGTESTYVISGYLQTPDGITYHGNIIGDRNGNTISETNIDSSNFYYTDTLGQKTTVTLGNSGNTCDTIALPDPGTAPRQIQVCHAALETLIQSGVVASNTIKLSNLFPGYRPSTVTDDDTFSAIRPAYVLLPNNTRYTFKYNPYGELTRIELPTGGAIEYTWDGGLASNVGSLGIAPFASPQGLIYTGFSENQQAIYRRVTERREYADGTTGQGWTSKTIYSRPETLQTVGQTSTVVTQGYVAVSTFGTASMLSSQKHYYTGSAGWDLFQHAEFAFEDWTTGREIKVEQFDGDGTTLLRTEENNWAPRLTGIPVTDPRVTQTITTQGGAKSSELYCYDSFNNQTDVYEFDYGYTGSFLGYCQPGTTFVRHTHYAFEQAVAYVNPSIRINTASTEGAHLRRLLTRKLVCAAVTCPDTGSASRTDYAHDERAFTATRSPFTAYAAPSGVGTGTALNRGNVTTETRWVDNAGTAVQIKRDYDNLGSLTKITNPPVNVGTPLDSVTQFAYDDQFSGSAPPGLSYAFPTDVTDALGYHTTVQYDLKSRRPAHITDSNGVITQYLYDSLDRVTSVAEATNQASTLQTTTTFSRNDTAGAISVQVRRNQYSPTDSHPISEVDYDGLGRQIKSRVFEGAAATSPIDTEQDYDGAGRIANSWNPRRGGTRVGVNRQYDGLGRIKLVLQQDGYPVNYTYPTTATSTSVTVVDEALNARRNDFDGLGRLTSVTEAPNVANFGYTTNYGYDLLGNLLSVGKSGSAHCTVGGASYDRCFAYDMMNRLKTADNPETGAVGNQYDAAGNLVSRTSGGVSASFVYDAGSRQVTKSYNDGTQTAAFCYDGRDYSPTTGACTGAAVAGKRTRLTAIGSGVSVTHMDYDARGRVSQSRQTTGSVDYPLSYSYYNDGSPATVTYQSGRAATTCYDLSGRAVWLSATRSMADCIAGRTPLAVTDAYASSVHYTPHGAVDLMQYGNQLWESAGFNTRQQPLKRGLGNSAATPDNVWKLDLNYTSLGGTARNNNGNVLGQTVTTPAATFYQYFDYDALNRLMKASEYAALTAAPDCPAAGSAWCQQYSYDAGGNRMIAARSNLAPSLLEPAAFDGNNRMTTGQLGGSFAFDARGNVSADPSGAKFGYDGEGRIIAYCATPPSGSCTVASPGAVAYAYDGLGQRVQTTAAGEIATFIYGAGGQLAAEFNRVSAGPATIYPTADPLGSTRVITDGAGVVEQRLDYYPFGETIAATVQNGRTCATPSNCAGLAAYSHDPTGISRLLFTGKERDAETGLDYFGARYYSGAQGRFTSPDAPFADQHIEDPQSWNMYAYVRNNPLKNTDPNGRDCFQGLSSCGNYVLGGFKTIGNIPSDVVNAPNRFANVLVSPFTSFRFLDIVPSTFTPSNSDQRDGMEAASGVMIVSPLAEAGATGVIGAIGTGARVEAGTATAIAPKIGEAGGPGAGKRFPNTVKDAARAESSDACVFCGQSTPRTAGPGQSNIDHAIPKSRNGNNTLDNAQNTCRTCNQDKGTRTTQEYQQELRRRQQDQPQE